MIVILRSTSSNGPNHQTETLLTLDNNIPGCRVWLTPDVIYCEIATKWTEDGMMTCCLSTRERLTAASIIQPWLWVWRYHYIPLHLKFVIVVLDACRTCACLQTTRTVLYVICAPGYSYLQPERDVRNNNSLDECKTLSASGPYMAPWSKTRDNNACPWYDILFNNYRDKKEYGTVQYRQYIIYNSTDMNCWKFSTQHECSASTIHCQRPFFCSEQPPSGVYRKWSALLCPLPGTVFSGWFRASSVCDYWSPRFAKDSILQKQFDRIQPSFFVGRPEALWKVHLQNSNIETGNMVTAEETNNLSLQRLCSRYCSL